MGVEGSEAAADETLAVPGDSAMSFRRRMREELEQGLTATLPKRMNRLEAKLRAVMEGKEVPSWPPARTKSFPSAANTPGTSAPVAKNGTPGQNGVAPAKPPRVWVTPSSKQKSVVDPPDAHPDFNMETRLEEYTMDLSEDLQDDIRKVAKIAMERGISITQGMKYEEFKEKMASTDTNHAWRMIRERNRVQAFDVLSRKAHAFVVESLRSTLQCLKQEMIKREGQAKELHSQLACIQETLKERKEESRIVTTDLDALMNARTPAQMVEVQNQVLQRREKKLNALQGRLKATQGQATRLESIARKQRAYLLQDARINSAGGTMVVSRHPAGALCLEAEPLPQLSEDDAKAAWDVGSACCNPYVTDSWPIHPNALAQRSPEEPAMEPWSEEESDADASEEEEDEKPGFANFRDLPFSGSSQGFRESPF
jgi:hypothetical protein